MRFMDKLLDDYIPTCLTIKTLTYVTIGGLLLILIVFDYWKSIFSELTRNSKL